MQPNQPHAASSAIPTALTWSWEFRGFEANVLNRNERILQVKFKFLLQLLEGIFLLEIYE